MLLIHNNTDKTQPHDLELCDNKTAPRNSYSNEMTK
uniref:Uncharacterized protein n=1 Tax=Rhizophora mucronata TaxID=61149 RepID=A0A2P2P6V8_RHIMU